VRSLERKPLNRSSDSSRMPLHQIIKLSIGTDPSISG
jgi:hypothetical protein